MFIILRMALGWHFLYEGVWKIENRKEFSAKPYLAEAKGPTAGFFYAMLPDLDGRERLSYVKITTADGKPDVSFSGHYYLDRWEEIQKKLVEQYKIDEAQTQAAQKLHKQHKAWLDEYLKLNQDEMLGYFRSLDKLEQVKSGGNNGAPYEQKRLHDRQQELRKQVDGWVKNLDQLDAHYQTAAWDLLESDQQAKGGYLNGHPWNPLNWTRMEQLNAMVTYSLTAIGLALIVGCCTRLAALGGAAFMGFIVLSQFPWPTIYPPPPPVVGHALFINKDVIEFLALVLVASVPAGRWGGLDYFLYRLVGRRIGNYFSERV
jgi:uncharacterized membrane protein YphA (DoxX/SURF4 family)